MKKALLIISFMLSVSLTFSQSVIFLHHSTGAGVYNEGNVVSWISNYNSVNGTSYQITERYYPNYPYPTNNYPFDYWNLWVNGECANITPSIECLDYILQTYDVIIFKQCFPGAGILEDDGNPLVSSDKKTLENYKLQYRALRSLMDGFPDKKFIVWTLAPLHRLATTVDEASRAKEFVDWVKTSWLTEDLNAHPNIFVFDFFGLVAESNQNPQDGLVNCLKYDYEKSHIGDDSHPNLQANEIVGPKFAEFIVNAIENQATSTQPMHLDPSNIVLYPNPVSNALFLDFPNLKGNNIFVEVIDLSGTTLIRRTVFEEQQININTTNFLPGYYLVKVCIDGLPLIKTFQKFYP